MVEKKVVLKGFSTVVLLEVVLGIWSVGSKDIELVVTKGV